MGLPDEEMILDDDDNDDDNDDFRPGRREVMR